MTPNPPPPPPKPPAGPRTPPPPAGPKKTDAATPRPLATLEEVSAYLGVPAYTLYAWRRQHKGPKGARVGRFVRYKWSDVEAWFDAQAVSA